MSTCTTCGNYYRINPFHNDCYNCQDCTGVILEEDTIEEIQLIVNPQGKTLPKYNEEDSNEVD